MEIYSKLFVYRCQNCPRVEYNLVNEEVTHKIVGEIALKDLPQAEVKKHTINRTARLFIFPLNGGNLTELLVWAWKRHD